MSHQHKTTDFKTGFVLERKLYLIAGGLDSSVFINLDTKTSEIWDFPVHYDREDLFLYLYCIRNLAVLLEDKTVIVCGLHGEWTVYNDGRMYLMEKQSIWNKELIEGMAKKEQTFNIQQKEMLFNDFLKIEKQSRAVEKKSDNGKVIYQCASS